MAAVLSDASRLKFCDVELRDKIKSVYNFCESERLVFERDFPLKRFKFQRVLSDYLLVAFFPDDIQGTTLRRLVKYFPSVVPLASVEGFDVAKRFSASLPCCVAQLFRTLGEWMDHNFSHASK